jgi:hypothetical protein
MEEVDETREEERVPTSTIADTWMFNPSECDLDLGKPIGKFTGFNVHFRRFRDLNNTRCQVGVPLAHFTHYIKTHEPLH